MTNRTQQRSVRKISTCLDFSRTEYSTKFQSQIETNSRLLSNPSVNGMSSEQLAKLRSELDVVQTNVEVFAEMLVTMQPAEENPQDFELLMVKIRTLVFLNCF